MSERTPPAAPALAGTISGPQTTIVRRNEPKDVTHREDINRGINLKRAWREPVALTSDL